MSNEITGLYRDWFLTITDDTVTGERFDSSGDRFECHHQPGIEGALRMAKAKVNRLEGDEVWDETYEDEALR